MTFIDWSLLVVALAALGYLIALALRKAPQLSIVDPMSSREAKSRERKHAILEERMTRQLQTHTQVFWRKILRPVIKQAQDAFRRLAGKLTAIERRYAERQHGGGVMDATGLKKMIEDAKFALAHDRYDRAEEMLIAVVSHDPKNTEAYEVLGRMYLVQGQYNEAKESLEFLAKLSPKDPSVMVALGEVYEALGDKKTAFRFYEKGKEASPNNPKYLDFFIESAIEVGEFYEAQQGIDHLKQVNPENQKIETFEKMLAEKRTK